jgi:DNA polymerase
MKDLVAAGGVSGCSAQYATLVRARKSCHACDGLVNPASYDGGILDSDQIGPWSLWQGNLNAGLVIVGQDWGDTRYFSDNGGRETPRNPTNKMLRSLLGSIGINIAEPTAADAGGGTVFLTNAILCLKNGGMQAKVRSEWFTNCGARFLRPTIDLIAPKVVVTLGEWAYSTVTAAYGLPRVAFRQAVEQAEGFYLTQGARYFPMYHCGARILNSHRPLEQQLRDWARVGGAMNCTDSI